MVAQQAVGNAIQVAVLEPDGFAAQVGLLQSYVYEAVGAHECSLEKRKEARGGAHKHSPLSQLQRPRPGS